MVKIKRSIIPLLALVIFIIIMTTGSILKQSFHKNDRVMHHLSQLSTEVKNNNWMEAHHRLSFVEEAWEHVVSRIQFSSERNEINHFKLNLERVRGFIQAKDKPGVLSNLAEMKLIWNELGN